MTPQLFSALSCGAGAFILAATAIGMADTAGRQGTLFKQLGVLLIAVVIAGTAYGLMLATFYAWPQ